MPSFEKTAFLSDGRKTDAAIDAASCPEILIIPIPPLPVGVAMAAIVELVMGQWSWVSGQ